MKSTILPHIVNLALMVVLLSLVMLPSFGGTFLVMRPPLFASGTVAGLQTPQLSFVVEPNHRDFDELVTFNPRVISPSTFVDEIVLTSFSGHLAVYNQLYTIRNISSVEAKIRVQLLERPRGGAFTLVAGILYPQDQPYFGKLVNRERVGATLLEVDEADIFAADELILLDAEVLGVLAKSGSDLVTTPLRREYEPGTYLYPQPFVSSPDTIQSWETRVVELPPRSGAFITILLRGEETDDYSTQKLPLKFAIEFLP